VWPCKTVLNDVENVEKFIERIGEVTSWFKSNKNNRVLKAFQTAFKNQH